MGKDRDILQYRNVLESFCDWLENTPHLTLNGVTDGKAIGTYIEQACARFFEEKAGIPSTGSSALGQDLPYFNVDVKATFLTQPQSSSPFTSIQEKIFGLPYNILLFVHTKSDNPQGARIRLHRVSYIPKELTADHRTSHFAIKLHDKLIADQITQAEAKKEMMEHLGLEEDGDIQITDAMIERIINNPPEEGVITITFALQWRLNYNKFKGKDPITGVADFR